MFGNFQYTRNTCVHVNPMLAFPVIVLLFYFSKDNNEKSGDKKNTSSSTAAGDKKSSTSAAASGEEKMDTDQSATGEKKEAGEKEEKKVNSKLVCAAHLQLCCCEVYMHLIDVSSNN